MVHEEMIGRWRQCAGVVCFGIACMLADGAPKSCRTISGRSLSCGPAADISGVGVEALDRTVLDSRSTRIGRQLHRRLPARTAPERATRRRSLPFAFSSLSRHRTLSAAALMAKAIATIHRSLGDGEAMSNQEHRVDPKLSKSTAFFDGSCALCRVEIASYRRKDETSAVVLSMSAIRQPQRRRGSRNSLQ